MFVFSWLKSGLNAGTMLTIATLACGLIAAHGRDRERMDDLDRRMALTEQNSVKRAEMDARDKSLTEILQSIDTRLATIERALMDGRRN